MIDILFSFGGDTVLVRVDGTNTQFANTMYGAYMASIDGIRLSKVGVVKEFPDLENDEDWRAKAISRFKDKLKSMATEEERVAYIIEDLRKHGYKPMFKQKIGFRKERIS